MKKKYSITEKILLYFGYFVFLMWFITEGFPDSFETIKELFGPLLDLEE